MFTRCLAMFGSLVLLCTTGTAHAAVLEITVTGLDLVYDGTNICDAASCDGGAAVFAEADPLVSVNFLLDGAPVGTLSSDIAADIFIADVFGIPVGGGTVLSGDAGFFDLLMQATGWGVAANIVSPLRIGYSPTMGLTIRGVADIFIDDLPFGLGLGTDLVISLATTIESSTDDGTYLTGFRATGGGSAAVPEPASMLLMSLGLLGSGLVARRRRQ